MSHEYRYAVNVKSQVGFWSAPDDFEALGETTIEQLFQDYAEGFWIEAEEIAKEAGYGSVQQEGRSGGWLVPMYSAPGRSANRTSFTVSQWLEDCYDSETAEHQARFDAFKASIAELLGETEDNYLQVIHEAAAERALELAAAQEAAIVRGDN